MKNEFDKKIRDLMEGSMPADAGFELGRNAVWSKIESKQKTKTFHLNKWISHAAAVIIGILLCLPFLFRSGRKANPEITITKASPASIQIIRDTIIINQKQNTVASESTRLNEKRQANRTPETITANASQSDLTEKTEEVYPIKEPIPDFIATTKNIPRPAVLHLMDIENENTNTSKANKKEFALFKKVTVGNDSDEQSETVTMFFSKKIVK